MGRRQFYAWVAQARDEIERENDGGETVDRFGRSKWREEAHKRIRGQGRA